MEDHTLQFYIGNTLVGKTDSTANAHRIKLKQAVNGGSLYITATNKAADYIDSAELYVLGRCENFYKSEKSITYCCTAEQKYFNLAGKHQTVTLCHQ